MKHDASRRRAKAFTLLETILSLSVLAVIISGAMMFANSAIGLAKAGTEAQEEARVMDAWTELIRGSLSQLPPEAVLDLSVNRGNGGYLPVLAVDDPGPSFSLAGVMPPGSRVELYSQPAIDGSLRVGLRWYDPEQAEVMRNGGRVEPTASLPLIDRLTDWNIEAWDSIRRTWEPVWQVPQRPPFLRFTIQRSGEVAETLALPLPPRRTQAGGNTPGPNDNGPPGGPPQGPPGGPPGGPGTQIIPPGGQPGPIPRPPGGGGGGRRTP